MIKVRFTIASLAALGAAVLAEPAAAQVFYQPPVLEQRLIAAPQPGFDPDMPGATPVEQRAVLVWSLRQALLLGALQCHTQYPALLATENYNALLTNHQAELATAFKTITAYFKRTNKSPKAAQDALDRFATRTTTSYSTVKAQQAFCHTAGWVGRRALFTPRGMLGTLASEHLSELRQSLTAPGEQQFRLTPLASWLTLRPLPSMDPRCWDGKGRLKVKKCGVPEA